MIDLIALEKQFCDAANNEGAAGWARFFAPHGAMVGSLANPPIVGPDAIESAMKAFFDTPGNKLVWTPMHEDLSSDGTLGYTYGIYQRTMVDEDGQKTEATGKYMTVWKRQENGQWLIEADIGN